MLAPPASKDFCNNFYFLLDLPPQSYYNKTMTDKEAIDKFVEAVTPIILEEIPKIIQLQMDMAEERRELIKHLWGNPTDNRK